MKWRRRKLREKENDEEVGLEKSYMQWPLGCLEHARMGRPLGACKDEKEKERAAGID